MQRGMRSLTPKHESFICQMDHFYHFATFDHYEPTESLPLLCITRRNPFSFLISAYTSLLGQVLTTTHTHTPRVSRNRPDARPLSRSVYTGTFSRPNRSATSIASQLRLHSFPTSPSLSRGRPQTTHIPVVGGGFCLSCTFLLGQLPRLMSVQ